MFLRQFCHVHLTTSLLEPYAAFSEELISKVLLGVARGREPGALKSLDFLILGITSENQVLGFRPDGRPPYLER